MSISERTPDAVLDFWLGPLRSPENATEDNWRNGMLKWRVGPFARGTHDPEFVSAQQDWCEALHLEGVDNFFADPIWETPKGLLAKCLVLDQFSRCIYRGTPVGYQYDELTEPMVRRILKEGWDKTEYNEIERMWAYMVLVHPESRGLQSMGIDHFTRWSTDVIAAVPKELKRINQFVTWQLIKAVVEHAEPVLLYGRFPHRNPILGRPHKAGEVFYLTSPMRPLWSFTQPPSPDYFSILGALCRLDDSTTIDAVKPEALEALHRLADLDPQAEDSLMDVFALKGTDTVGFNDLYRHMRLSSKQATYEAIQKTPQVADLFGQIASVILKDPNDTWPPKSPKHSLPAVIDVPRIVEAVRCRSFATGDLTVSMAAVKRLAKDLGLKPISPEELLAGYERLVKEEPRLFREGENGSHLTAPLGKKGFRKLCELLFHGDLPLEKATARLYEVIDIDYDHAITTAEALMGLSMFCPGTSDLRVKLLFEIFDEDQSGCLDHDELTEMLRMVGLRGIHMIESLFGSYIEDDVGMSVTFEAVRHYDEIEMHTESAISDADADQDGTVSLEEFIAWVGQNPMMRQYIEAPNLLFGALV